MNNLKKRVSYYYDSDVGAYTYGLGHPMKPHRIRVAHDLIVAYDMLPKMHVLRPPRASPEAMTAFHTDEYIHFLNRVTPETSSELTYGGTRFLVGEDNPPFEGVFEFCSISAGGSIAAARRLTSGAADIAINWAGGLHHAKKREASGFCYINDIVLGILELLRVYPRVLYIDIDCHHGDGVEEAFYTTDRVMTCTGTQSDKGRGKGKGYAVNVPLKDGISDASFASIFEPIIAQIIESFQPDAIVLQCGADSLSGDKLGCFNLTMAGHAHCVQFVRKQNIPFILLGGGGYTVKNVARTWAFETACALGIEDEIDRSLPWNDYFEWFGPRYRLEVVQNNMEDLNVKDGSLETVKINALEQLRALKAAPSVAMQDTPRESLLHELGFGKETTERDALDESLAQHSRFVYKLQESDTSSSDEEDDESDNSESTPRRRTHRSRSKRHTNGRMSLLTGRYFDVPGHHNHGSNKDSKAKSVRRFFQSRLGWSDMYEKVVVKGEEADFFARGRLAELMERGGLTVNAMEDRWGSEERLDNAEDEWIEMDED
ncbi:histone deacetylase [Hymenopellis radicata]|nr:histone deacetylase [Hymenopellis radicata]